MTVAVDFKWKSYGLWIHSGQLILYLTGVALFFGAQINAECGR